MRKMGCGIGMPPAMKNSTRGLVIDGARIRISAEESEEVKLAMFLGGGLKKRTEIRVN